VSTVGPPGALSAFVAFNVAALLQGAPTFRAEARLVVLHATVKNSRGELVTGLDRDAFAVYEDGKRQRVTLFRRDDVPVSIGLLIDNSGSMESKRAKVERRRSRSSERPIRSTKCSS
jgi:Ca-activated chloride channel family protein